MCTTRKPSSTRVTAGWPGSSRRVKTSHSTPACASAGGERADVHVHAATVAGTRLGEGRRVHAEDGNPANRHLRMLPGDPSFGCRPFAGALGRGLGLERPVDLDQRLLLALGDALIAEDLGRRGRDRRRARRGCRRARTASRPRCAGPSRSPGGSRPTACAGRARSGSGTGSRCRRARSTCAARAARCGAAHG